MNKNKGTVFVKAPKKKIEVYRFESQDDQEGKRMNSELPIEVTGEQELSIVTRKGKPVREVVVFLSSGGRDNETVDPQDTPDKLPLDFGPRQKTLVSVF